MKIAQDVRAVNVIMIGKDPMVVQKADFSKFHQWYLRDLQRLKV